MTQVSVEAEIMEIKRPGGMEKETSDDATNELRDIGGGTSTPQTREDV